jgi:CIC family chloride channel protein
VTIVKALASAVCIGSGGSVGREGPIVQIGSAMASTLGQMVRMSESRLRVLVACGAAAGISATFNAPLTGVFFGFELILREVSLEGFVALLVASMAADTVSHAVFGSQPFFSLPSVAFNDPVDYLLCAVLAVVASFVGVGFKTVLYRIEDLCDLLWRGKPEWLRPAVGGVPLGLLLLAVPQMYGVGYPVMQHAMGGGYVFSFLLLLVVAKIVACSLTIGIGGSGGVFAPSLFIGASLGMAFGLGVHAIFGIGAGPSAAYGMVAMGAVFAGAARAPLTATSSVTEMTGDVRMVLPVMLGTAIASVISARLTHGTIYTTKLIRRGIDIERPKPATLMQTLSVADAMIPFPKSRSRSVPPVDPIGTLFKRVGDAAHGTGGHSDDHQPVQTVFANESLEQALRQLVLHGHEGLPVLAEDGETIIGWITNRGVMRTFAKRLGKSIQEAERGAQAAEFAVDHADRHVHEAHVPLPRCRRMGGPRARSPMWPGPTVRWSSLCSAERPASPRTASPSCIRVTS